MGWSRVLRTSRSLDSEAFRTVPGEMIGPAQGLPRYEPCTKLSGQLRFACNPMWSKEAPPVGDASFADANNQLRSFWDAAQKEWPLTGQAGLLSTHDRRVERAASRPFGWDLRLR
jgi:hypothetical protein